MIINFVLILSVLLGCCTLALDIGLLELRKLQIQNAADAAALGALFEYEHGNTNFRAAAIADAGLNGFVNGTSSVTVTATHPPVNGNYTDNLAAVQATVTQQVDSIFKLGSYKLTAQATGLLPPCMYLMSTSSSTTTMNVGTGSLVTAACSGYVGRNVYESSGSTGSIYALYIGGPYSSSTFNGTGTDGTGSYIPTFGFAIMSDPVAYIASPVFSACTSGDSTLTVTTTTTLSPGTYCGLLTIKNSTVTLNPGLYIITGGASWTGATVKGIGVTLFLTKGGGSGYGKFSVSSNSVITLSAPTTTIIAGSAAGGVAGVTVFGDRSWTGTTQDFAIANSTWTGDGMFYLTNTGLVLTSSTLQQTNYLGLVIDNLSMTSSTLKLACNYASLDGGNPFRPAEGLAE